MKQLDEQRKEFIQDFYYKELGFCGCGSPENILYVLRELLNTIKRKTDRYKLEDYDNKIKEYSDLWRTEIKNNLNLQEENIANSYFSINEGVLQILLNILNNIDVLEHGFSINGSWLTEYGEELLTYLNELSDEDLSYILQ